MDAVMVVNAVSATCSAMSSANTIYEFIKNIIEIKKEVSQPIKNVYERTEKEIDNNDGKDGAEIKLSQEEREALLSECRTLLTENKKSAYMSGAVLYCDIPLDKENRKFVKDILEHINGVSDDEEVYVVEEGYEEYQEQIDDEIDTLMGGTIDGNESDYEIYADTIILNFSANDYNDTRLQYDETPVKNIIDALNHILCEEYITAYNVF
jgi:hypothetical protein